MASDDFPQFTRLPKEIQHEVWKLAVVEENKGRIISLHEDTHRLVPTKSCLLAPSPVFSTTKESRSIAKLVYSTPIAVFKTQRDNTLQEDPDMSQCEEVGKIRISWEHDTFLLGLGFDHFRLCAGAPVPSRFTSTNLTGNDLKKIMNVIEYRNLNSSSQPSFDKDLFAGVDTYYQFKDDYVQYRRVSAFNLIDGYLERVDRNVQGSNMQRWLANQLLGPMFLRSSQDPEDVKEEPHADQEE
ncbi:hypothetical protein PG991_013197 [Apiospora marii]|uniref:2EXR domain-containing protein n=1 Tax=Apiospora marii TaxID=335849 RepID=A0ABR1R679_9PEZI